ncbi:TetR/AcrR family transcriptional regulator [Streptococcus mutans]|uniref:TetR/AcrR family transcriptional regulator n=1 Tax=Streptococcus mutans TaxID=1309 RepID=UPI000466F475|nr:TetR/AcrR family transcriptional regulator [Streptococcus mutans]MCB5103319.1 TetR/AcrR family transcriptional regulator [Streptococcus mutans]MCB5117518.1 TetR/AcrR family transcriptional regulator [Streptococcus mutans]MCY7129524.1 TetR/AcrR family transcriptional regulator [Streptococcus mutans]OVF00985.1 TetR family transcriptional regulator [Streptococcus mutans]
MVRKDKTLNLEILNSAKKEFLTYGYQEASLRRICKNAGVTTGALYKRYSGKEVLFGTLLEPTVQAIEMMKQEYLQNDYQLLRENRLSQMWNKSLDELTEIMYFIYDHEDNMRLLLFKSHGSKFETFQQEMIEGLTDSTYHYLEQAYQEGKISHILDKSQLCLAMTAYYKAIIQPLEQGWSYQEALLACQTIIKLFNWSHLLGF